MLDRAAPDYEQLLDRKVADDAERVRLLTERIMAEVERDLHAAGETRSPEQWEGLRWASEVIAMMALGAAEPLVYVSPLDTGVGKTALMLAATRAILNDPELSHVGIISFVNRRALVGEIVKRLGLAHDDPRLAVYFAQRPENLQWNSLGVGTDDRRRGTKLPYRYEKQEDGTKERVPNPRFVPPPQDKAQLLITTQALLESRSSIPGQGNFADNHLWHYRRQPRQVRIWDETVPPTKAHTLTVQQIKSFAVKLSPEARDEVLQWADKLLSTEDDTVVWVPEWSTELAKKLKRQAKPKDQEPEEDQLFRSELAKLAGRPVRVYRDKYYEATAITYSDALPRNFTPLLVLDAKANQKAVYREWKRGRGNLVFGPSGKKDCPVYWKHWDRAAGKEQHRTPEAREQIAKGAAQAYREALEMGAEKVLLVKYKMEKPSYDIEPAMLDAIAELKDKDGNPLDGSRLVSITWGGENTGTNAYMDIGYQIHVGQHQAPLSAYMAMQRGASGVTDHAAFDWKAADTVRLTEVAATFHQTIGRGTSRKMKNGKCPEAMHVWTIFASSRGRMRLPHAIFEQYSEVKRQEWHPLGVELAPGRRLRSENREPFFRVLMQHKGEWFEADAFEPTFSKQMVRRFLTNKDDPIHVKLAEVGLNVKARAGGKRRGGTIKQYRIEDA